MGDENKTLQEIQSDIKDIKIDLNKFQVNLMEIKSKMPSMDKVQQIEIRMTELQTQFKVVWAALGAVGIIAISSVIASLFRILGM